MPSGVAAAAAAAAAPEEPPGAGPADGMEPPPPPLLGVTRMCRPPPMDVGAAGPSGARVGASSCGRSCRLLLLPPTRACPPLLLLRRRLLPLAPAAASRSLTLLAPCPSCPNSFEPHERTSRAVTTTVCSYPTATQRTSAPARAASGTGASHGCGSERSPSPSWPRWLLPHT